jgi:hypothetical protein
VQFRWLLFPAKPGQEGRTKTHKDTDNFLAIKGEPVKQFD